MEKFFIEVRGDSIEAERQPNGSVLLVLRDCYGDRCIVIFRASAIRELIANLTKMVEE